MNTSLPRPWFPWIVGFSIALHTGIACWLYWGTDPPRLIKPQEGRVSIQLQSAMMTESTPPPAPELPPLEPLPETRVAEAVPLPPPEKSPAKEPQTLSRPTVQKVANPNLEAVTQVKDLPARTAEASQASQGVVDDLPRKLSINKAPKYPDEAVAAYQEGTVTFLVRIEANGRVSTIRFYKSSRVDSLDHAALAAVRNWVFEPARRGGRAVPYEVLVPVVFSIRARR